MSYGVEYIRELCKEKKISISRLEKDLGFSNGYLNPKKLTKIPYDRAVAMANYLNGDINRIMNSEVESMYYINEETVKVAQEIFENKELRMLFDVSRDADPEDLRALHSMALALKRKERGNNDEGC